MMGLFWTFTLVFSIAYFVFLEKYVNGFLFFVIYSVIGFIIYSYEKNYFEKLNKIKSLNNEIELLLSIKEDEQKDFDSYMEKKKKIVRIKEMEVDNKLKTEEKRISEFIDRAISQKAEFSHWIASLYADYKVIEDYASAKSLENKKRPAFKAADELKRIAQEKRDEIAKRKEAEYLVSYYESLYPALVELRSPCEPEEAPLVQEHESSFSVEGDDASYWLSKEEYNALPAVEKYQLALDRYWKRRKSKWEIGRDFERFIGYKYEQDNYDVYYKGIIDGLEDLGRDLICKKKGSIHVVQCKYWSCSKEIHEKHINQLFGTTAMHYLQSLQKGKTFTDFTNSIKSGEIVPVFVTSTKLSDTAIEFAKTLGVVVRQGVKLEPYPLIKCNVSKRNGEKIYHLPFDQQYDKIKIEGNEEFFAHTIKEAEEKGFRRAFKWRPE